MIPILLCAALAAALAGCAPAPEAGAPFAAPEETRTLGENEYVLNANITVDDGRELSLRLCGVKNANQTFGISEIDVYDGDAILQTIDVKEAIAAEWDEGYTSDATEAYAEDGGLTVSDMNFDGAGDIGLLGWLTAGANEPYYYWLWNGEAGRFEYAFCLCNAVPDEAAGQIVSATRVGADCSVTDRYEYAADGGLLLAKREIEAEGKSEEAAARLSDLLLDISEHYHPGTAGCSLVAAKYAGTLLDLNAEYAPEFEHVGDASSRFYFSLDQAAAAQFRAQLNDVCDAALLLAANESADLMESAGFAPQYAPWDAASAELFLSGLYWGIGLELPLQE